MPFLSDKCEEIRNWLAIGDDVYPNPVVTGWIRMAEEYLSTALRVKHMVQIDTQNVAFERVPLPLDWQEIRLVRVLPSGGVYRYQTPDAFYNPEFEEPPAAPFPGRKKRYTILGNYLILGEIDGTVGTTIEMTYYQDIPPLTEEFNNWINHYHSTVYTLKILHIASLYAIEDQRSGVWNNEVGQLIMGMNARHQIDKASGSTLAAVRRKSFG